METVYAGRKLLGGLHVVLGEEEPLTPQMRLVFTGICVFLVVLAGLMAGLTLGLMSLDRMDTEVIKRSGTAEERWLVEKIEPMISNPHYLLVTLLLTNALAMEALPLFLDRLFNPVAAVIISVTAILLFGEVIPQAVCKSRKHGLRVGAYLSWLVRGLMLFTAPISWPVAKLLDWLLGEETVFFRRPELKALVTMHAEPAEEGADAALTEDEVNVIQGALDMATKTAEAAMTPLEKVFMVSTDDVINDELLRQVIDRGHSRVPVYEGGRQNIVGLILVKELVLVDEDAGVRVRDLRLREVPFLRADIPMYDVLKVFRTARSHMAVLTRGVPPGSVRVPSAQLASVAEEMPAAEASESDQQPLLAAQARSPPQHAPPPLAQQQQQQQQQQQHPAPQAQNSGSEKGSASAASSVVYRRSSSWGAGGGHPFQEAIGLITIEDVLEELLQQEIVDETDRYVDNLQTVRTTTLLSLQHLPPNLRKFLTRTFRAGSPVSKAAFQAALAAQSPFAGPSTLSDSSLASGASPEKQAVLFAAVAAAAKAASQAEEATAEVQQRPSQRQLHTPFRTPPLSPTSTAGEEPAPPGPGGAAALGRAGSSSSAGAGQGLQSPGGGGSKAPRAPLPRLRVRQPPALASLGSSEMPLLQGEGGSPMAPQG